MHTATILRFPGIPTFTALRTWRAGIGHGAVVAVLYRMPVNDAHHSHADQRGDQRDRAPRHEVADES